MRLSVPLLLLLVAVGCTSGQSPWVLPSQESDGLASDILAGELTDGEPPESQAVELNHRLQPAAGFRGDVHSLVQEQTQLGIAATWSPIHAGRALRHGFFPQEYYEPFMGLRPAVIQRTYDARDFSAFLPANVESVGQTWSIDPQRVVKFLRQFHTSGSTNLVAPGRRAGPNGAIAILRAISPTHLDIVFRIHAEFALEPGVYLTPSCFLGGMTLNRQTQSVERFEMSIPHDKALNAILTVRLETEALIDIVNIERMELAGGDPEIMDRLTWDESLELSAAHDRLKHVFFPFLDIEWISPDQALAMAQKLQKPIMAVVVWGCLDEQNC